MSNLKTGKNISVRPSSYYPFKISLVGKQPDDTTWKEYVKMTDYFYDGLKIHIKLAQNGYHSTVSVEDGQIEVVGHNVRETINHGLKFMGNLNKSNVTLAGEFQIRFRTDCGDPSKDKSVVILVIPNHETKVAIISYTVS